MITPKALVLLLATATLGAWGAERPQIFKPNPGHEFEIGAISNNGIYAISQTAGDQETDNPQPMGGAILNIDTRELINVSAPMGSAGLNDVADNGLVVGASGGKPAWWSPDTRQWTAINLPSGVDNGAFLAVTPDAHYAVGYLGRNDNFTFAKPICYDLTTGHAVEITNLPEVDLNGENKDQNVFFDISPDGRYILAQMSQSFLQPLSMVTYIYDVQQQTWTPIGYDYDATTKTYTCRHNGLHFIDNQAFSPDGKWVTGTAYMVKNGGDISGGSEYRTPYRYNVAEASLQIYDAVGDHEIGGNAITNDGVVLGSTPVGNPYPTAVIRSGNFFITLDQVLSQVYNMSLLSQIGDNITGAFRAISADGLTAAMVTYDNCYIIKMPEPFADAAARVDLLANYTPSIPNGSTISRIGEIKLTFDRDIACKNLPSQIQLLKSDGTVVRNANSSTIAPANSHQIIITFRTQTLDPNETYTVNIPADYIWLADDPSFKSKQISLQYTGRSADPVKPVSITPADGSVLSSLDYSSARITVRFDSEIMASTSGAAALYNADDDSYLTPLTYSVSGRHAYFYPDGEYKLYYGSNYRVEIGAGCVTDLAGASPNEAITINYRGSYIREVSADDEYIYHNDCNDYTDLIFWQNDWLEPAQIPASWFFTANDAWLLIRDNENNTDQALGAHSMFAKGGTSDDWLMTPQLFIPDNRATLVFDAQSYMHTKNDRLKVYVYVSDMIYNYLSADLTTRIRTDGDLVFDEQLSAGPTDEGLDGEWTRYSVSLADYAGKNIYIAFVNQNTDQSAVFIDNIAVKRDIDFMLTNSTARLVVAQPDIAVQGILSSASANISYTGVTLTLRDARGQAVSTLSNPQAVISSTSPFVFVFDTKLPLTIGDTNTYTIDVAMGQAQASMSYNVKNLAFRPTKRVVLEEYTGSECGNCPQGICALEHLESIYPDNFIPVALRTYGSDMYAYAAMAYSDFLGLDAAGAPSARINRGEPTYPMANNGGRYILSGRGVTLPDGTTPYLWVDAVQDALTEPAEMSIEFVAGYDANTGALDIPVTVKSALNATDRNVNLFAVVIEDNLVTSQANYMTGINDPLLGEWGMGGIYAVNPVFPFFAKDVVRYVISGNAFNGTPMSTYNFTAGEAYTETITATLSQGTISNPANSSVVVMLIDGSSHTILNANKAKLGSSGIADINAGSVSIDCRDGIVSIAAPADFTAAIYSPAGLLISSAAGSGRLDINTGYTGMAIVSVTTPTGTITRKINIR